MYTKMRQYAMITFFSLYLFITIAANCMTKNTTNDSCYVLIERYFRRDGTNDSEVICSRHVTMFRIHHVDRGEFYPF